MNNRISDIARNAGIVGAGGAGFPTQIKLDAKVERIIVNGAECEPLITVDQYLMLTYTNELAEEANLLRRELGADKLSFAIKKKHQSIILAMQKAVSRYPGLEIAPLGDFYPAGDEAIQVYEVTGRVIPEGGIPLNVSVVVTNVETLWNLYQAEQGAVNTDKWLTVAGLVRNPGVYRVPIGISIEEILKAAGAEEVGCSVIDGGPMMGKLVMEHDLPITKTIKSLLIFPQNHPVILNARADIKTMLRQAQSMCCQCRLCTDLCPRNLLGYKCEPHRTILNASYGWSGDPAGLTQALACSQCGACDMYACPMGLSPRRINAMLKELLGREKVQDPNKGLEAQPSPWRQYRRIPTQRLSARLGIDYYESPVKLVVHQFVPDEIVLPFKQHIGAPAKAVVQVGETVSKAQLVADIPENSPVSSKIFSSIDGRVAEVNIDFIRIVRN